MEERKIVQLKKDEYGIKEYIKGNLGKGKVSNVTIEYTPIGEKIIVATDKPGFVIGRKGEKIESLTTVLKKRFHLENPNIEIFEIMKPEFDAQLVADEIALSLEKKGILKFKVIAYKTLESIMRSGALGVEIRLSGRLPSERAKSWRFAAGYLKKTGETSKIVSRAKAVAQTSLGITGVQVSILSPEKKIHDRIDINEEMLRKINENAIRKPEVKNEKKARKAK